MSASFTLSLDQLPPGKTAVVRQLRGGTTLTSRLAALGLTEDAPITVLQNNSRGPMLVKVRDTRLALGRGEAMKILVERTGT